MAADMVHLLLRPEEETTTATAALPSFSSLLSSQSQHTSAPPTAQPSQPPPPPPPSASPVTPRVTADALFPAISVSPLPMTTRQLSPPAAKMPRMGAVTPPSADSDGSTSVLLFHRSPSQPQPQMLQPLHPPLASSAASLLAADASAFPTSLMAAAAILPPVGTSSLSLNAGPFSAPVTGMGQTSDVAAAASAALKAKKRRYNVSRLVRFAFVNDDGRVVLCPSLTWFCAAYHLSKGRVSDMNTGVCKHHMHWRLVLDANTTRRILAKPDTWRLVAGEYRVAPSAITAVLGPIVDP